MEVLSTPLFSLLKPTTTADSTTNNAKALSSKKHRKNLISTIGKGLKTHNPLMVLPNLLAPFANLPTPSANALTYEEALQQGASTPTSASEDVDVIGAVSTFLGENSVPLIAGVVAITGAVVLSRVFSGSKNYGSVSALEAYGKLSEDSDAELIDVREIGEIKESGNPDLRELKKRVVKVVYKDGEDDGFLEKVLMKFKDPGNTTLYILDRFDGYSSKIAKLVAENGFKSAFAIKDGAEGPRGWQNSGLPWLVPKKALSVDFSSLKEALDGVIEDGSGLLPVTVGVAAATGVSIAAASEIETILQLLGSAAIVQVFVKKLLFAEDRKKTIKQIQEFLDTKVAPAELVDELKVIGKSLLPKTSTLATTTNGAPVSQTSSEADSPLPVSQTSSEANSPPPVSQTSSEANSPPPVTAAAATSESVVLENSAPVAATTSESEKPEERTPETKTTEASSNSVTSTPQKVSLSPYPQYPDFKPPTSPCPSKP